MSNDGDSWRDARPHGFTLIEVIGALVILSVGILMVMQTGSALTWSVRHSGARSEIVVLASEQVDSVEATPFDSLTPGTTRDTLNVQGWTYTRSVAVTLLTPVLARIEVSLVPVEGQGPTHRVTSYTSAVW